jgi:hypothetical protein
MERVPNKPINATLVTTSTTTQQQKITTISTTEKITPLKTITLQNIYNKQASIYLDMNKIIKCEETYCKDLTVLYLLFTT